MSGAGRSKAGVSPYGIGTPAVSSANGGAALPDATGAQQGSRYLDPLLRVYVYDANGRAKGAANVPHLVQLALFTTIGTSAMTSLGAVAPSGVIGSGFDAKRKQTINSALKHLVDAKLISIKSIDVDSKSRPVHVKVTWIDLTTSVEQETRV